MKEKAIDGYEIILTNSTEEISKVIYQFIAFCNKQNLSLSVIYKLRLAMEEILVNTISYSFVDDNLHNIQIKINHYVDKVVLEFLDDGVEFDPLSVPEPKDIPLEERKPGGIGIYLVKTLMDTFKYKRINGRNILTISKKIN